MKYKELTDWFQISFMSRKCDLHDSRGVNVATYLWDNLWRDIRKIRPQCDPCLILSSYSLYLHIRCTILFLEFRLYGEKLFFMAIPKSHFTCHRRSPPFFRSNNKIRIADPAKWLNFQIIILTVQNYFTPPRDEVDNMGNSDSKASLKTAEIARNYDGYTGHE